MKYFVIYLTFVISILFILFTACGFKESEIQMSNYSDRLKALQGINLEPEKNIYPIGINKITMFWVNDSTNVISYGDYFELFRKEDDIWIVIEDSSGYPYSDISYELIPDTRRDKNYYVFERFGSLNRGEYKIAAIFNIYNNEGKETELIVFGYFSISVTH
ncbi:MAG: hypothetical protein LBD23_11440, partial [Oscillospiraceae bacterium]|nr:hypothetical protein [Oscillospiraceae bacterium]